MHAEPNPDDIQHAFTWYCDFLAAQGMDVPASWGDLSHTRRHILRETARRQQRRQDVLPSPRQARTVQVTPSTPAYASTLREKLAARKAGSGCA